MPRFCPKFPPSPNFFGGLTPLFLPSPQQQPRGQTYTPVNGCWDPPPGSRLPPVWDWALRYSPQQRARFRNPAGGGGGTLSPPDTGDPQTTATVSQGRAWGRMRVLEPPLYFFPHFP